MLSLEKHTCMEQARRLNKKMLRYHEHMLMNYLPSVVRAPKLKSAVVYLKADGDSTMLRLCGA